MTKTIREVKPNNPNDWSSRFDKKFTRKCLGGKEKGQYMDKWFVRETTAKELKNFISSELQSVFEEIGVEIEMLRGREDNQINYYPLYKAMQRLEKKYLPVKKEKCEK